MTTLLEIQNLSKSFLSNRVLRSINFDVRKGEVHALIGENGAGKSTLVNIIAGIHKRDEGTMVFNGTDISFNHPLEAMKAGISLMHQELSLVPNATVAENIYLRREKRNRLGFNDWAGMNREAAAIFERIGIDIDPKALVGTLSVGMQQIVELAKAISLDAKLIIMDEPTSSLSEKETVEFFKVMRDLKARGISLIFISHKLSELFEISDRITVLRDGQHISTDDISTVTADDIIRKMVGRHLGDLYPVRSSNIGDVVFSCRGLTRFGAVRPTNFDVCRGEIVGIAGLVGAGRTEAMRALINADKRTSGQFWIEGNEITIGDPGEALSHGIVYLSEDRKSSGLFLSFNITDNVGAATLDRYTGSTGMFKQSALRDKAKEFIGRMDIRPPNEAARVVTLSGGNQQKVLLAKALDANPKLLIVDEPTRGVDVGAKSLIHARIRELAETGIVVIVISSEMPEVIGMADRILVFRNGGISAELDNRQGNVTQEIVMTHAVIH
jgi:ABC-type sugar transport system ATPase subunit